MRTASLLLSSLPVVIDIVHLNAERCMFARSLSPVDRTNQKGTMSSFAKGKMVDVSAFGADAAEKVAVSALSPNPFLSELELNVCTQGHLLFSLDGGIIQSGRVRH